MKPTQRYFNYTTKRTRKTTFRDVFFIFTISIACLAIFLGVILPAPSCSTEHGSLFVICSGSFTTRARAEERATTMQQSGAGGYIHKQGGMFFVYSAAYVSERDCDTVLSKLGMGHEKKILTVSQFDDLSRLTQSLGTLFYALDGGSASSQHTQKKLIELADAQTFHTTLKDIRQKEGVTEILNTLKHLSQDELGATIKYFQLALLCLFVL